MQKKPLALTYLSSPFMDMITFGYRWIIQHWAPCTLVSLPFIALTTWATMLLSDRFSLADIEQLLALKTQETILPVLINMIGSLSFYIIANLMLWYFLLGLFLWTKDSFIKGSPTPILSQFLPNRRFLSLLGILCFYVGVSILTTLPGVTGTVIFLLLFKIQKLLAFLILGLSWLLVATILFFFNTRILAPCWFVYAIDDSQSLAQVISQTWQLTHGFFWRTFAFNLLLTLIHVFLQLPFLAINHLGFNYLLQTPSHMAFANFLLILIHAGVIALSYWIDFVFTAGGSFYAWLRYTTDLKQQQSSSTGSLEKSSFNHPNSPVIQPA